MTLHLRFTVKNTLVNNMRILFPEWDGDTQDLPSIATVAGAFWKIQRQNADGTGSIIGLDVYLLVADDFVLPIGITGTILTGQRTHGFLGHPDN